MAVPLDVIRAFHHAFRKDMAAIDEAAYRAARGEGGLELVQARHSFYNEVLDWHAKGEEANVFPALERVAPLVAEAYERDHRGLDAAGEMLHNAVTASDPLATARASSAFSFHLSMHLTKEEAHLYRIFDERISLPAQGAIIANLPNQVPQGRLPEVVSWLFPLIGPEDREKMVRIWQQTLPAPAFAQVVKLVQAAIGPEWAELARGIPGLQ